MKNNELVWRTIADEAFFGRLRWDNLADLAFKAGVPLTTTHLATQKLEDIGAILRYGSGGFSVANLEKVVTLLSAWRNLSRDSLKQTDRNSFAEALMREQVLLARGGADAAIFHLGGNQVADVGDSLVYGRFSPAFLDSVPDGEGVTLLPLDQRAEKDWDGFSSIAQTMADLFATSGWQAAEFRLALMDKFLPRKNWEIDG